MTVVYLVTIGFTVLTTSITTFLFDPAFLYFFGLKLVWNFSIIQFKCYKNRVFKGVADLLPFSLKLFKISKDEILDWGSNGV